MRFHSIDLDRIEVIRGPGSALWGPGVEAGVVHFISKSPFQYRGTTVSVGGGERNAFQAAARHAGALDNRLGYKVLAFYNRADDWQLDLSDPIDLAHSNAFVDQFITSDGEVFANVNGNLIPESFYWNVSGYLEYLLDERSSISAGGGYGFLQNNYRQNTSEWYGANGNPFAQIRFRSEDVFLQANWFRETYDEKSFLYRTGVFSTSVVDTYDAQAQYSRDLFNKNGLLTLGGDFRLVTINSTITGRFTDDAGNGFKVFGGYLQYEHKWSDKFSSVIATRLDRFEVYNQTAFSPRAALIYKPWNNGAFRLTYNRAVGAPNAFDSWIDLTVGRSPAFNTQLIGGATPISFTKPTTTSSIVSRETYEGVGMPAKLAYELALQGLDNSFSQEALDYLDSRTGLLSGFSEGFLLLNGRTISQPTGKEPFTTTLSSTFELGYNGRLTDALTLKLDLFYTKRKDFATGAMPANPFVFAPNIKSDLLDELSGLLDQEKLKEMGTSPEAVLDAVGRNAESLANRPIGLIEPDQALDQNSAELIITYFNSGDLDYYGLDVGLAYGIGPDMLAEASYSYISDNYFDDAEIEEEGSGRIITFNIPRHLVVLSASYLPKSGVNGSLSVRYTGEFEAVNGPVFSGKNDAYTVIDAGIGYAFNGKLSGLSLNVTATNLLNDRYRPIPGTPKIGRLALANVSYSF